MRLVFGFKFDVDELVHRAQARLAARYSLSYGKQRRQRSRTFVKVVQRVVEFVLSLSLSLSVFGVYEYNVFSPFFLRSLKSECSRTRQFSSCNIF